MPLSVSFSCFVKRTSVTRPDAEDCEHPAHRSSGPSFPPAAYRDAAALFRALGDQERLRLLGELARGARCVSEIAACSGSQLSTVSQRLRILRTEGLVTQRRQGKHIYYALTDGHLIDMVRSALEHANEGSQAARRDSASVPSQVKSPVRRPHKKESAHVPA